MQPLLGQCNKDLTTSNGQILNECIKDLSTSNGQILNVCIKDLSITLRICPLDMDKSLMCIKNLSIALRICPLDVDKSLMHRPSNYCIFHEKARQMKKAFCFKNYLATFFGRNLVYAWFKICPSYLSRKKGTPETFFSLGLIISQSRPTASASKNFPFSSE